MYIPHLYQMTDRQELIDFMQRYSFATIITASNNFPVATQLPFMVEFHGEDIVLTSHFAKANEQWKLIEAQTNLVLFSEPHAYISPTHYEKLLNVPTWNYISVHAYGKAHIINEQEEKAAVLEQTIANYEAAYKMQWDQLPEDYRVGMMKGIVAFEIVVADIQGKKKLSQNKTAHEQANIVASLAKSTDSNEQAIASYMKGQLGESGKNE